MNKKVKMSISVLVPFLIIANLAGCSNQNDVSVNDIKTSSVTSQSFFDSGITSESMVGSIITADDKNENTSAYYDDVFKGFSSSVMGPPLSYEETINMINDGNLDSYYLVETIRAVPLKECIELTGWDEVYADRTMYEVKVISDIITGEKSNRTIYVLISMGTPEFQDPNDPTYAPGDLFTVALTKETENEGFVKSTGGFMFRYDVIKNDDSYTLYSRNNIGMDELGISGTVDINKNVITSTTDNPVLYTQSVSLSNLTEFIKNDWNERNISTHFEEVENHEIY